MAGFEVSTEDELKLDGYRAIGFKRNRDVCLRSRNDNDFKDIRRS